MLEVCALTAVLALTALSLFRVLPHRHEAIGTTTWWVPLVLAIAYGIAEANVFHFEFRKEAISFSLSEVPTAFALVYLAPGPAVAARVVGSLVVVAWRWRSPAYKLAFNGALFAAETLLAFHIVQAVHDRWPAPSWTVVLAVIPAVAVAGLLSIPVVTLAIVLIEGGGAGHRLRSQFASTGWLVPLNATVAASTLAPTLVAPWMVLLSLIPLVAFWAVMSGWGNLQQRHRDLGALHGFLHEVGRSLQVSEIGPIAAAEAAALMRARRGELLVFTPNSTVRYGTGSAIVGPSASEDPAWVSRLETSGSFLAGASAFAPVRDGDHLLGVLAVSERDGVRDELADSDLARLSTMADQLAPSLRKAMFHEQIEFEARHDPLTGLPNRSSFHRAVDAECATATTATQMTVLVMGLDRFKEVNDTLGHMAGDALLVEMSQRIRALLDADDGLARLAGDEFAVVARRSRVAAEQLVAALLAEAHRPFPVDGVEVVIGLSIGSTTLERGDDATTLLRRADIAMHTAKARHTGHEPYRVEIDRRTPGRLAMLGDLRNALDRADVKVHFQPKLDLATGVVVGVEALARWAHEVRGTVAPEDFVHIAEETGLITQLTDVVLDTAVEQVAVLHRRGHHLGLAVNLSTHDLLDDQLPERVTRRLDRHGVDPSMLTLEITESALLIDASRARRTIDRLNRTGVRLSIDDFGTGYSSLSYLRHLPVAELKIDRGFVTHLMFDEQDEVIVRSIIELGHNLGLQVVAEGVETDQVLSRLRMLGCDVAQGYGICRPVALDQFATWLRATHYPAREVDPLQPETWSELPGD